MTTYNEVRYENRAIGHETVEIPIQHVGQVRSQSEFTTIPIDGSSPDNSVRTIPIESESDEPDPAFY